MVTSLVCLGLFDEDRMFLCKGHIVSRSSAVLPLNDDDIVDIIYGLISIIYCWKFWYLPHTEYRALSDNVFLRYSSMRSMDSDSMRLWLS